MSTCSCIIDVVHEQTMQPSESQIQEFITGIHVKEFKTIPANQRRSLIDR